MSDKSWPSSGADMNEPNSRNPSADDFSLQDMLRFAGEAWGELGRNMVNKWAAFNEIYFGGNLRPIPLIITPTLPYGSRRADCNRSEGERLIRLNVPKDHNLLVADNDTLLHEMIHQYLFECGESPGHESNGWRREIMRLNKVITGNEIWAGRSKTVRKRESADQKSYVVRINEPAPDGRASLTQMAIARWPHGCRIDLGQLGSNGKL